MYTPITLYACNIIYCRVGDSKLFFYKGYQYSVFVLEILDIA